VRQDVVLMSEHDPRTVTSCARRWVVRAAGPGGAKEPEQIDVTLTRLAASEGGA
jgi:hypothetical protein